MASGTSSGPVQIATIETPDSTSVAKLDVNNIKTIIQRNNIEDIPVALIAVAGTARKGKSFLLNLMIAYLKHISQSPDIDFTTSSSAISGLNWAGGRKAVTKGIWLWNEAFIIKRRDNSKVAILLVDTQGICDGVSSARPQVDNQIIYMTLSMATVYIHNVEKTWSMPEKKVYQICKSFGEVYGGINQVFNSFTLLYRDWGEDRKYGLRPDAFKDEIAYAEEDAEALKIVNGIEKLFTHRTAWVLPEPSDLVRTFQENGSISVADIGKNFLCEFKKLAKALFDSDGYYSGQMDSAITGRKFLERMEDVAERLSLWPELTADADQLRDMYVRKAYNMAKDKFEENLKSIENTEDIQKISEWFAHAESSAIDDFRKEAKNVKDYDTFYRHYLEKIQRTIEKKKDLFIHEAEIKVKERQLKQLLGQIEDLKTQLQQQRKENAQQMKMYERQLEEMNQKVESLKKEIANKKSILSILRDIALCAVTAVTAAFAPAAVPAVLAAGATLKSGTDAGKSQK